MPTAVAATDVNGATRVVTFDVTLARAGSAPISRWDKLPAFSDGYGPASKAINGKVTELLRELEAGLKKQ